MERIKNIPLLLWITLIYSVIYILAWYFNAHGSHYNLGDMIQFYMVIVVQQLGKYTVNSVFNSPKGEPIQRKDVK